MKKIEGKIIDAQTFILLARQKLSEVLIDENITTDQKEKIHYAMFRLIQADKKL